MFRFRFVLAASLLLLAPVASARVIPKSPVDHATIEVETLPREGSFVVARFGVARADVGTAVKPGKTKAQLTAELMKESAPTLMQDALVRRLTEASLFTAVTKGGEGAVVPEGALTLEGEFTVLDPGSKGKRLWVGMGAGRSEICIEARVLDASGKVLGTLRNCRYGTGNWSLAGGQADAMMTSDVIGTAVHVSDFLAQWATGKLAR